MMVREIDLGYLIHISIFYIFFCFSFFGVSLLILRYFVRVSTMLEWYFFNLKFNFYLTSIRFSFILFLVTLRVLIFASFYIEGDVNLYYFLLILIIFVGSIFFLNFRYRGSTILIMWDILGISRFFLVLFYNNWDRCRGAINTVLTNRVGDYFLFLFFRIIIFRSLNFFVLEYFFILTGFLLILAGFTKRAQFPFRG